MATLDERDGGRLRLARRPAAAARGVARAARQRAACGRALLRDVGPDVGARGARAGAPRARATRASAGASLDALGAVRVAPQREPGDRRRDGGARRAGARRGGPTRSERDLKIGPGGIREAEFFVQSLQLDLGRARRRASAATGTSTALRRLRARGLVTDREGREMADAYLALRRLEHRIQFATGLQTHALPAPRRCSSTRIARSLGFRGGARARAPTLRARARGASRRGFARSRRGRRRSPERRAAGPASAPRSSRASTRATSRGPRVADEPGRPRRRVRRRPTWRVTCSRSRGGPTRPLGATTPRRVPRARAGPARGAVGRRGPGAGRAPPRDVLRARRDARASTPALLADDPRVARRWPPLRRERVPRRGGRRCTPSSPTASSSAAARPTPRGARASRVDEELATLAARGRRDPDAFVGALRRAKAQVPHRGRPGRSRRRARHARRARSRCPRSPTRRSSAMRFALRGARRRAAAPSALAVIAMGKLGGQRDRLRLRPRPLLRLRRRPGERRRRRALRARRAARAAPRRRPARRRAGLRARHAPPAVGQPRAARRLARGVRALPRPANAGTRRRRGAGAGLGAAGAAQGARLRRRRRARRGGHGASPTRAAYERGAPAGRARCITCALRMERELGASGGAARARYDLKLGRGGLVDVEFAAQWLQMKHGARPARPDDRDRGRARRARGLRATSSPRSAARCARGTAAAAAGAAPARAPRDERAAASRRGPRAWRPSRGAWGCATGRGGARPRRCSCATAP